MMTTIIQLRNYLTKKICIKFFQITFFDKEITPSRNTRKVKSISIKINFPEDTNKKDVDGSLIAMIVAS